MSAEESGLEGIPLDARMALASIKVSGARDVVDAMTEALSLAKGMGVNMVPVDNVIEALNNVLAQYSINVSESVL